MSIINRGSREQAPYQVPVIAEVPTTKMATELAEYPEGLKNYYDNEISLQQLMAERGGSSEHMDNYLCLGPENMLHYKRSLQRLLVQQNPSKFMPEWAYTGQVATFTIPTVRSTTGGFKSEEVHSLFDMEFAPGFLDNQADIERCRPRPTAFDSEGNPTAYYQAEYTQRSGPKGEGQEFGFAVFMVDPNTRHPLHGSDPDYDELHDFKLMKVISSDQVSIDGFVQYPVKRPTTANNDKLLPNESVETSFISDKDEYSATFLRSGEVQANQVDGALAGFRLLVNNYEAAYKAHNEAVETKQPVPRVSFRSFTRPKSGEQIIGLWDKTLEQVDGPSRIIMTEYALAIGALGSTNTRPVPALEKFVQAINAANAMQQITNYQIQCKDKNVTLSELAKAQIEEHRSKIRIGFLRSLNTHDKEKHMGAAIAYTHMPSAVRWTIEGLGHTHRRWGQLQQVINIGEHKKAAEAVAQQYGQLSSDARLYVKATPGNELVYSKSLEEDDAQSVPGFMYGAGKGMAHAAPDGAFSSEMIQSVHDNKKELMMPGFVGTWRVDAPDLEADESYEIVVIDLDEAPTTFSRQIKALGGLSGYGAGLRGQPYLSQMLENRPEAKYGEEHEYGIARIGQKSIQLHTMLYEGSSFILTRDPTEKSVWVHTARVLGGAAIRAIQADIARQEAKALPRSQRSANGVNLTKELAKLTKEQKEQAKRDRAIADRKLHVHIDNHEQVPKMPTLAAGAIIGRTAWLNGPASSSAENGTITVMRNEGRAPESEKIVVDE
jgi:hypothetical protein